MRVVLEGACFRGRPSGYCTYTRCLCRALARIGHDVTVVADKPLELGTDLVRTMQVRSRFGPVRCNHVWRAVFLPAVATRLRADVIHYPTSFPVPRFSPYPLAVTIHDVFPLAVPDLMPEAKLDRVRARYIAHAHDSDVIITLSEHSKADIVRYLGAPPEKVRVVWLAASDVYRPLDDETKAEARRRLRVPDRFILCVNGASRHKNIHSVLDALHRLNASRRMSDLHLVLACRDSEYVQECFELAGRLGVRDRFIHLAGVDDDGLCALYNLAEAFVFPSLIEGFGLPIVEAMSCGTPVVTSDFGAMKEVASDGAVLVNSRDSEAIAEAVSSLLSDRSYRDAMSKKALERASCFSWEKTARGTAEAYASICK